MLIFQYIRFGPPEDGLYTNFPWAARASSIGPSVVREVPGRPRDAVEGVHPLGQIVKVLAVSVPFKAFVEGLGFPPLFELLADPAALPRSGGVSPPPRRGH